MAKWDHQEINKLLAHLAAERHISKSCLEALKQLAVRVSILKTNHSVLKNLKPPIIDVNDEATLDLIWRHNDKAVALTLYEERKDVIVWMRHISDKGERNQYDPTNLELLEEFKWLLQ